MTNSYIYSSSSQILCQRDHNDPADFTVYDEYFYVTDRLGSVRLVVNEAGDVNNSYTYNPFGEDFAAEVNETVYNPFKFIAPCTF